MRMKEQYEDKPSMTQVMAAFEEGSHVLTTASSLHQQLGKLYSYVHFRWFRGRQDSDITDEERESFKKVYSWLIEAHDSVSEGVRRSNTVARQTSEMIRDGLNLPESNLPEQG